MPDGRQDLTTLGRTGLPMLRAGLRGIYNQKTSGVQDVCRETTGSGKWLI